MLKIARLLAVTFLALHLLPDGSLAEVDLDRDGVHPRLRSPKMKSGNQRGAEDADFWMNLGKKELERMLKQSETFNTNVAKNVIIFIGDGMSLPTVYSARLYKALYEANQQNPPQEDVNVEGSLLTFETFPHAALIKTYCVDQQTSDSSATASAIFSGVKTMYSTLGFDSSIEAYSMESQLQAKQVETVFKWAQDVGKDTGFVTTARVSHATPSALFAHSADRDWECDSALPEDARRMEGASDITLQLVTTDPGRRAKVVFGGGLMSWLPVNKTGPFSRGDYDTNDWDCPRLDGRNLVEEFLNKSGNVPGFEGKSGKVVYDRDEMMKMDPDEFDYFLGLFSNSHMEYEHLRATTTKEPSLPEMTQKAIEILSKNQEKGFFLMVEGSNIDHGHHTTRGREAIQETMMLDKAVEVALSMVNVSETLILVTADHGHTNTAAGYQTRGSDILGIADFMIGADGLPFTTINYANGKGFYDHLAVGPDKETVIRPNLTDLDMNDYKVRYPANVPLTSETHSGADVGIFATGPFAHLFQSVHDQSFIAQVVAYSACMGPHRGDEHCPEADKETPAGNNGARIMATIGGGNWDKSIGIILALAACVTFRLGWINH